MAGEEGFLMILPIILCIVAIVANIIMVAAVRRKRRDLTSANFLFTCNGLCNIATSFSLILKVVLLKFVWKDSDVLQSAFTSVTVCLSSMQLIVALSLGYDRYIAVAKPIIYRSGITLAQIKKQLFLGLILCLVLIAPFSFCSQMYNFPKALDLFVAVSRLTGAVTFLVIYINIVKKFKRNAVQIAATNNTDRTRVNATREAMRGNQQKHIYYMCFSISTSFFVLNIPVTIYKILFKESMDFQTIQGKIMLFSMTAVILNLALDPFFYFYAEKRCAAHVQTLSQDTASNRLGGELVA